MTAHKILIIEDEHALGSALELLVRRMGHLPTVVASGAAGLAAAGGSKFDAVVLDIGLPDMSGLKVLESLRESGSDVPVLVITAHATLQHAIDSQKSGATAYLNKPLDMGRFQQHLAAMLVPAAGAGGGDASPAAQGDSPTLIGAAPSLRDTFVGIARACTGDLPVLISGPGGSGKSLVANVIHAHGVHAGRPVHELDCSSLAAWPPDEAAEACTIVLDEVTELPDELQSSLAKWLGAGSRRAARVMATTRLNPQQAVADSALAEDLYYALSPLSISLPPLSERSGDLPALCDFFAGLRDDGAGAVITPPVMAVLQAHLWPGNVRELRYVLDYAFSMSRGGPVFLSHLPQQLLEATEGRRTDGVWQGEMDTVIASWLDQVFCQEEDQLPTYDELLQQLETRLLRYLMERHDHRPTRLASELKLHRGTLRQKLQRAGLQRKDR